MDYFKCHCSTAVSTPASRLKNNEPGVPTFTTPPPDAMAETLAFGQVVMGNYQGMGEWVQGKIMGVRGDGTYDVLYDHAALGGESEVPLSRLRPVDAGAPASAAQAAATPGTTVTASSGPRRCIPRGGGGGGCQRFEPQATRPKADRRRSRWAWSQRERPTTVRVSRRSKSPTVSRPATPSRCGTGERRGVLRP